MESAGGPSSSDGKKPDVEMKDALGKAGSIFCGDSHSPDKWICGSC